MKAWKIIKIFRKVGYNEGLEDDLNLPKVGYHEGREDYQNLPKGWLI